MEFTKDINCRTCKHGYFCGISWDSWHNLYGVGNCYLCAEQYGYCDEYEKGDIPEGKERV